MNAPKHISNATRLKWLLKREYWENRGGFLWAPLVAGGISLLLTLLAIVASLFVAKRAAANGGLHANGISVNGLDLSTLLTTMSPADIAELGKTIDYTLLLSSAWPFIVLAFVVFFYCLGALHDDRRDRSVLFWKSLPVSDAQTVVSKAISALFVAPSIAVVVGILTLLGFLLIISLTVLFHGGNPITLIWQTASPLSVIYAYLAWIPVYLLWAMPTIGWLLLCSAWARSKPFLWAVMVPVFAGVIVSWFSVMKLFGLSAGWFWGHIVSRLLLSTVPGSHLVYRAVDSQSQPLEGIRMDFSPARQLAMLGTPELWIGVVVGVLFLLAAVHLRRTRDDA